MTQELRGQAAAIVGSVDFLGNPMGLINDVSLGLEGLVKRGNVGGLFLNVAHGVSDSAAKVSRVEMFCWPLWIASVTNAMDAKQWLIQRHSAIPICNQNRHLITLI